MSAESSPAEHAPEKARLRREMIARRRALSTAAREAANEALCTHVSNLMMSIGARRAAAYVPLATEPGGDALVPVLASCLEQLYLPISEPEGQLSWAEFRGFEHTRTGPYSIPEPTGPRHPSSVLSELDVMIVPALAATPQGCRLGKGGGYYDRALASRAALRPLAAVLLFDDNLLPQLPTEDHDAPVDIIITPSAIRSVE
ncbi:5-formyltetrahydrofolate cyclo-ligase [Corynebacterium sp. TAE3-ERU30]|uniref:5-formyltetrahydrofolate cyclo-ligase n=1 Tax=Corynebacterium sp. TAE3-ERU30 TaxID=2849496 RepID=UPI001C482E95|nr:5-formyltetrahydrofolate cyclo-ligase [Corynebacterium sp. TAE3-ERU30]MBV7281329.1 5-formyltetrahydrofolate cyclo-ligase [Corynebacterium sp. TAE3-ERU30]